MARSEIETLLPLDSWAAAMGLNPWEFNQVGEGFPNPNNAQCPHVWFQYSWQEDFLSRDELARSIEKAEEMIAAELHYWPAPKFFVNEVQPYPRPHIRTGYGAGGTVRGQWKSIHLNWGKVQSGGTFVRTAIDLTAAVAYNDGDSDGVDETFTVIVPTAVTNPDDIAVYFTIADRSGEDVSEGWRIRPIRVKISGGNATITGHASMLVKPVLTTITNPVSLDVGVAGNFVTEVEVYGTSVDTATNTDNPAQGTAMWEDPDCINPPCNVAWTPLCIGARNAEVGVVSVDYWLNGTTTPPSGREPDRVSINYLAGEPLQNGRMTKLMADIVSHLATGILPVGSCGCDRSDRIISWWREFPSQGDGDRAISFDEIDQCPFGQSRGALWAWWRVKRLEQLWAVSV